jgi:hypothetical protein
MYSWPQLSKYFRFYAYYYLVTLLRTNKGEIVSPFNAYKDGNLEYQLTATGAWLKCSATGSHLLPQNSTSHDSGIPKERIHCSRLNRADKPEPFGPSIHPTSTRLASYANSYLWPKGYSHGCVTRKWKWSCTSCRWMRRLRRRRSTTPEKAIT